MEKRIGSVSILIYNRDIVPNVNLLLSEFAEIILARQGLPLREHGLHCISLIVQGTTDQLSALTGKLGRLSDVEVRSMVAKKREAKSL